MKRDRWQQVKAVFDAALDREPSHREAFLDDACEGDPELRASVEALLTSDDMSKSFLEPPVKGAAAALLSEAADHDRADQLVGCYRLGELVGSGGMATVYKAVRADRRHGQQVAVKLIKPGMASDDILRRFRQERQLLAALEHPNIAKLLDGGATDDGTPYLVLEYVEGKPVHDYCDEHKLSIAARLELFRVVCSAVQHAHRNLVVHRDLKPGHILVTEDGTPKLVDFGIAKIVKGDVLDEAQTVTVTSQRLMTPQYASPEQARGDPVTTCSDVYSLGVILYELLCGHRPYDLTDRSPHEAERLICDIDPDTPSTAVIHVKELARDDGTTGTITPDSVSQDRNTHSAELRRRLRGDLDTIVLTAIHKDRQMRYASVALLSEDIRRYLEGLPVLAHRDTLRYRAGKFLRRNKLVASVAAVALLSLIGGVIGTSIGLVRTASALKLAEKEASKASRINEFLHETLGVVDPQKQGRDVAVRDVLDVAAARLEHELGEDPAVKAALHLTIGSGYRTLGLYERAERHLRSALDLRRQIAGCPPHELAQALNEFGLVLTDTGHYQSAKRLFREAVEILRAQPDHNPLILAGFVHNVGIQHIHLGDYAEAEAILREALEIYRKSMEDVDPEVPLILHSLASVLRKKGDYEGAEEAYDDAIAIQRKLAEKNQPNIALGAILNGFAVLKASLGQYIEAEKLFREVLEIQRGALGPEHPDVGNALTHLGAMLVTLGRYEDARPLLTEALAVLRKAYGDDHITVAICLTYSAMFSRDTGDHGRAVELHHEALAICRRVFGEDHEHVGYRLCNLGRAFLENEDHESAEPLYREAMTIFSKRLGDNHPSLALALNGLGQVQSAKGEHVEAQQLIEKGLVIRRHKLPKGHPSVSKSLYALGTAALNRADPGGAQPVLRECLEIRRKTYPKGHRQIAMTASALGEALTKLGRYDEAELLLVASLPVLEGVGGLEHRETRKTLNRIVELYEAWGKPPKAALYRAKIPDANVPVSSVSTSNATGNPPGR